MRPYESSPENTYIDEAEVRASLLYLLREHDVDEESTSIEYCSDTGKGIIKLHGVTLKVNDRFIASTEKDPIKIDFDGSRSHFLFSEFPSMEMKWEQLLDCVLKSCSDNTDSEEDENSYEYEFPQGPSHREAQDRAAQRKEEREAKKREREEEIKNDQEQMSQRRRELEDIIKQQERGIENDGPSFGDW